MKDNEARIPVGPSKLAELEAENAALRAQIDTIKRVIERNEDENKRLRQEVLDLKGYYEPMETEFARMRAQLDIVYLIFGGKR